MKPAALLFSLTSFSLTSFLLISVVSVGVFLLGATQAFAQQIDYERPVDVAPSPEDIGEEYVLPVTPQAPPRAQWREAVDVAVLAAALLLCTWIVLVRRSRRWLVVLSIGCLLYFGFYREGCICPIGAIQNVVVALTDPNAAISYFVIAFFLLPLIMTVLFGRVFCGGVCPLGALQDLVLLPTAGRGAGRYIFTTAGGGAGRYIPLRVPRVLDKIMGTFKWVYLVLAIWLAARPTETRDFIICRFDPFVGFFRFTGPTHMLLIGAGLLVLGMFLGRPYCRYLCPYGAILSLLSRISWRYVTITPDKELDCGLCAESCPYGAMKDLRAEKSSCLFCARCFNACPRHRVRGRPEVTSNESSQSS